jgi:SAM-dependent methyltransferase
MAPWQNRRVNTAATWHPPAGASIPAYEPWLDRWRERLGLPPRRALDVGCGAGLDTHLLASWGHSVTAVDSSASAVAASTARTPSAAHHVLDLRELPGPLAPGFEIVVASLSLHYFDEPDTRRIFATIRDLIVPGGVLAFRVNAEDDFHYGATGSHATWELTAHHGAKKQFFTESKIRDLLAGWATIEHLEKRITHRFSEPKSLFEVVVSRS